MASAGMLDDGVLSPAENLTSDVHRNINGRLYFLANRGKLDVLKKSDANNLLGEQPLVVEEVLMALNIENRRNTSIDNTFIQGERYNEIDVDDFTKVIPVLSPYINDDVSGLHVKFDLGSPLVFIKDSKDELTEINYTEFLDLEDLRTNKYLLIENDLYRIKVYFNFMDIDDNNLILNLEGIALFQKIRQQ